jgi:ABC-type transport system involved in multi-copper enzyme maturation permease subunit
MSVVAIARDQLAALRRQRVILVLIIASVLLALLFCVYLVIMEKLVASGIFEDEEAMSHMSEEQRVQFEQGMEFGTRGMQTGLYALVSFVGSILSLVMFCSLVSKERTQGSIQWLLAKPLSREQFLLGKWLGACAMLVIYTALMSAILLGYTWFAQGSVSATTAYTCVLMLFKFVLVGAVGGALAMLMPPVLGGMLAYFAGAEFFQALADIASGWAWLRALCTGIYYVLPSYGKLSAYTQFFMGTEIEFARALLLAAYALAYSALMFFLATAALRRRDLA